jgi:hypothetical protein
MNYPFASLGERVYFSGAAAAFAGFSGRGSANAVADRALRHFLDGHILRLLLV